MNEVLQRAKVAASRAQPAWTPERAEAVAQSLTSRRARRRTVRGGLMVGVSIALAICLWVVRSGSPAASDGSVEYADGTRAVPITPHAELGVLQASGDVVASVLQRGGYRFSVTKDAKRRFRVRAGGVQVEVLGTEFTIERLQADRVRVEVHSGRVRVSWLDQETELGDHEAGVFPRSAPSRTYEPAIDAGSAPSRHDGEETNDAPSKPSWQRFARTGDYDRAYSLLQHEKTFASTPEELLLAADVARLSRHPESAVAPLQRLIGKHAKDPRAPLAAFTLGRVLLEDLGRPRQAALSFERARRLSPAGPLVQDALAREVEAWFRADDTLRAKKRADQYLSKFPNGPRVHLVRRFGGIE